MAKKKRKHKKRKRIQPTTAKNIQPTAKESNKKKWTILKKVGLVVGIFAGIATVIGTIIAIKSCCSPKENGNDSAIHVGDITISNGGNANIGNTINNYVYGENVPDLSQANEYYSQGCEYFRMSDYDKALERYDMALNEYENKPVTVDKARIQYAVGLLYKTKGNLDESIQWYSDAIGTLNSLSEPDETESDLSYVHYLRGNAYLENHDLERALLDCNDSAKYWELDDPHEKCTYASIMCLKGRIYMASWYNSHSQFPDDDGEDLEVSWLDAMKCFEKALEWNGMRLSFANSKEVLSGNNTVLRSYIDYDLGIKFVYEPTGFEINPGDSYWIIDKSDAETAMILNNRSLILLMVGVINADYLNEAEANSETALQIYNSLPADKREGIQNTYHNLALITLYKNYIESGNKTISPTTAKTYCEWMELDVKYTKKWCGQSKTTAIALENLGIAYLLTEDPDSAKESFLEAKSIFGNLGLAEDAAKQDEFLEDAENFDLDGTWEVDI